MWILLAAHAAVAAMLPWCRHRVGRRAVWLVAALPPLATVAWAAARAPWVLDGGTVTSDLPWAATLSLSLALRLDALSLLMLWIVGGVGALVLLYCRHYVERDVSRQATLLLVFAGAMTGLVLADNLFVLYVFWELTTVLSFLLIGGRGQTRERRDAAEQALLVTIGGGLAMLLGFVLLGEAAGTYRISEILAEPPDGGGTVRAAVVLILVGAFAKSAQMPLHGWLPAAMVAPTPVSAYLHAAAMVKAGVYLIGRLAPALAEVGPWRPMVLTVGLGTMVLAAWRALRETDLKLLLAYGTISTLGMLTALLGAGTRTAALAGAVLLLAHAAYKAALFLTVGVVDRQAGTRDLRQLSGLGRRLPLLCALAALAAASLAELPPLVGFLAKETALKAFWPGDAALPVGPVLLAAFALGATLTVAYAARFLWGAFAHHGATTVAGPAPGIVARPAHGFLAPIAVLAAAGGVFGLWYAGTATLATAYADAYPPGPEGPYHVALWHGLTPVLGVSALTIALGLLVFFVQSRTHARTHGHTHARTHGRRSSPGAERPRPAWTYPPRLGYRPRLPRIPRLPHVPRLPDPHVAYGSARRALDVTAVRVTRHTQVGSLPVYLAVLLLTMLVELGVALLAAAPPLRDSPLWRSAMEAPLTLVVLAAATAVLTTTHRLTGLLLVGAVGYGVAGLFLVHGAPDLALTQFLVETVTLVVVVLVLRWMPSEFTPGRTAPRVRLLRATVSTAVGVLVAVFALAATSARDSPSASALYLRRVDEAGAYNVVNAIIVDFRAMDTLGEIAVLLVMAIGVVSVVRVRVPGAGSLGAGSLSESDDGGHTAGARRYTSPATVWRTTTQAATAHWDEPRETWLPGAHERPGGERSVLLEVVARLLFPSIIVLSLFLLFSGHYRPGGGFSGGLVAGQAFVLRYLVGGRADFGMAAPVNPGMVAGSGLALAATVGLLPPAFGGAALASTKVTASLPLLGEVSFATSMFFDIGVYVTVIGVTLTLLSAVGMSLTPESGQRTTETATESGATRAPTGNEGASRSGDAPGEGGAP